VGLDSEVGIVVSDEFGQESLAIGHVGGVVQAQLFGQVIPEGFVGAFYLAFYLLCTSRDLIWRS